MRCLVAGRSKARVDGLVREQRRGGEGCRAGAQGVGEGGLLEEAARPAEGDSMIMKWRHCTAARAPQLCFYTVCSTLLNHAITAITLRLPSSHAVRPSCELPHACGQSLAFGHAWHACTHQRGRLGLPVKRHPRLLATPLASNPCFEFHALIAAGNCFACGAACGSRQRPTQGELAGSSLHCFGAQQAAACPAPADV